jgi:hypothetical protein
MDVASALVLRHEAAEAVELGEAAFENQSVAAQLLAGLDTASCSARRGPATVTSLPGLSMIVGLVGIQFVGLASRSATPVGDQVALRATPASVGRVRPCLSPVPFLAAKIEVSMQARLQSIRSAARSRRSNSRCKPSHKLASCQFRRRRQQVMPDLHSISSGSISHWMLVRGTNRIPISAPRSIRELCRLAAAAEPRAAATRRSTTERQQSEEMPSRLMNQPSRRYKGLKGAVSHSANLATPTNTDVRSGAPCSSGLTPQVAPALKLRII